MGLKGEGNEEEEGERRGGGDQKVDRCTKLQKEDNKERKKHRKTEKRT